ncbi:MAG: FlgD immunoglobulin-like domain containing protein [Candidatus Zixiibacteriota bacterium]
MQVKSAGIMMMALCALAATAAAQPGFKVYRIKDTTAVFSTWYSPLAFPRINDQYQVVLEAYSLAPRTGVWSAGRLTQPALPPPPDTFKVWRDIIPFGINDRGHIAGYIFSNYHVHGFSWDDAVSELLPFDSAHWIAFNGLLMCERATAFDINDAGVVSGHSAWSRPDDLGFMRYHSRPVLWVNGLIEVAGTLPGYPPDSVWYRDLPVRINNSNQICGTAQLRVSPYTGQYRAFFGENGALLEIPLFAGGYTSVAYDISDSGHVVGYEDYNEGTTHMKHAWRYYDGSKIDIHGTVFANTAWSEAYGVNGHGEVVGAWVTGGSSQVTALYYDGDTTYNLNTLVTNFPGAVGGPTLNGNIVAALSISDNGSIVAAYRNGFFLYPCLLMPDITGVVVNSEGDAPDSNPNDGKCWSGGYNVIGEEECTLRAALQHANQAANRDTIIFRIPVPGVPSIGVQSELPEITTPVTLDATTQPTLHRVRLDGGGLSAKALTVSADDCEIRGLAINNFDGYGISLLNADSAVVLQNTIGPDVSGHPGAGNYGGIVIENSSQNRIGDADPDLSNVIAYNLREGVLVVSGEGNTIRRNIMYGNGGLGIDLLPPGVTPNDSLDPDIGPNKLVNFPILDSVLNKAGLTYFYGHIVAEPTTGYVIEFYINDSCDQSGYGEGELSLWTTQVTTNADGVAEFESATSLVSLIGKFFTATATDWDDNTSEFSPCWPAKRLIVIDAFDAPIANTWFSVYKVANDRPSFTEVLLDSVMSDAGGIIDLSELLAEGGIATGDSIKVSKKLASLPKARNTLGALTNAFTVYLDNAVFDQATYAMSYDELTDEPLQIVKLNHSTIAVNLIVGIQWEADEAYISNLSAAFRNASNYLYDVTDGQLRLDTVWIYNNSLLWRLADVRIYATNALEPEATADGIYRTDANARVLFCRRWFGSVDLSVDSTVIEWPMRPDGETNFRTIAHELGHYVLGFLDEYRVSTRRCAPMSWYGFMDSQYSHHGAASSEMSWSLQYIDVACRNNEQWRAYGRSCWDHFEFVWQKEYGGVHSPIIKPAEQPGLAARSFFFGPNDNATSLDYDVGRLIEFNVVSTPRVGRDRLVTVRDPRSGQPVPRAAVHHMKMPSQTMIAQGGTSSNGGIYVLGVRTGDSILASSALRIEVPGAPAVATVQSQVEWLSGGIRLGDSMGDSIVVNLTAVQGNLPMLFTLMPRGDSIDLRLDYIFDFPGLPSYFLALDSATVWSGQMNGDGFFHYLATLPNDTNISEGELLISARDLASQTFFVPVQFRIERQPGGEGARTMFSLDMTTRLELDSAVSDRTVILTSCAYPPSQNGVVSGALQVSGVQAVAVSGDSTFSEPLGFSITYNPAGVESAPPPQNEEHRIRVYQWNISQGRWELVGGWVDTSANVVYTSISKGSHSYYAAFTSDQLTSIDEGPGGVLLPDHIGLAQNYPNPFNNGTVIEFSLARAERVRLDVLNLLGQIVRVLVDEPRAAGVHRVEWDGLNQSGDRVATGIYLYRLRAGEHLETKKMMLLK